MVGRIIVGQLGRSPDDHPLSQGTGLEPIPEIALQAFPAVDDIMRRGIVRRV
ncbi:hypothetical protein [Microvirga aerilata]|uniref:hypothetical protein n=1 Tax=Microvirga aerilata TaxID=670292 RepID=UPI001FE3A18F|nr:hypothetical protein [Microvirga aerilata]